MTDELLTRDEQDALELRHDDASDDPNAGRRIRLRLVPWGVVAPNAKLESGLVGPETFTRGAFDGADPTRITLEAGAHGGQLVGRGTALEQLEDAAYLDTVVARTPAGDELLELTRSGVYRDASVAFAPLAGGSRRRRDGVTERTRVDLRRVAIVERGAYPGAAPVLIRQLEDPAVTEPVAPELTADVVASIVRGIIADALPAPVVTIPAPDPASESVLMRASSFGDLYQRVLDGDDELLRAFADQLTTDVPEIVRPAWLDTVLGILPAARPTVTAFGRSPLPATGMEVDWPTFDGAGDNSALRVAEQTAEKAEVISAKITLDSDKATVKTYGGGLDISWQTLRRSSPAFRDIALRILTTAWAQVTDAAFGTALIAKGVAGPIIPITVTADEVHLALVEASAMVDDATGAPASAVLAAPDAWLAIASAKGLVVPVYGTMNAAGTVQASSLTVNVSGLNITRDRNLPAGTILASNGLAASWLEDGMFTAEQDVVAKLGTDVAVWSLGAPAVYIPTGVVRLSISATARSTTASKA